MKHDTFSVTYFLINQKVLYICSLVTGELNYLSDFFVLLHCPVTTKILLECLANALDIQVVGQTSYRRNTLTAVTLLDTDMDFFFRVSSGIVSSVFKRVCFSVKPLLEPSHIHGQHAFRS